eukprot:2826309-Pyramimonas_sp.AAC.1
MLRSVGSGHRTCRPTARPPDPRDSIGTYIKRSNHFKNFTCSANYEFFNHVGMGAVETLS